MLAVRLHIHARSPLPSEQPVLWLAAGLLEDVAITGFVAAFYLALARVTRAERWTRVLFGGFVLVLLSAEVVWSEVLIYFGQPPSREELLAGMNLTFVRGSAPALALARTALLPLLFSLLLYVLARRAQNARRAWSSLPRLALVSSVAGAAAVFLPVSIHRRETAQDPIVAQLEIWSRQATDSQGLPVIPAPRLDPIGIRAFAPATSPRDYLRPDFPLAHRPPVRGASAPKLPPGLKPNFVFLVLESVRAEEVGAYGADPPGVTPNIDRLAAEGVLVERAYSGGLHTPNAGSALWYGIYPNPYGSIVASYPRTRLTGLPEVLRASGWRSLLWIHNGDQTFYHQDRFFRPRGFQMIDGRDFPRDDPRTGWGYSDRALARRAVEALDRAAEPFAAEVLTVSNHHPFQVPSDAQSPFPLLPGVRRGFLSFLGMDHRMGLQTTPMLRTVHYTDEAVGDFFRLASARPWFSRTVFVITGDHGHSIVPYRRGIHSLAALTQLRHRIPLILYSPMLAPGRVPGPASHVDVAETLLGLAGIELPRSGVGRDLLDGEHYDPHRPVLLWSAPGGFVTLVDSTRLYQATLKIEPGSDEPIHFSGEKLVDPSVDPDPDPNRLLEEPEGAARYRGLARVYAEVYPWLIFSGRSGVPGGPAPLELANAR
ncbi:MAG TPA: LTA synthase family protein [Thermoanaerobaculia bacterium]